MPESTTTTTTTIAAATIEAEPGSPTTFGLAELFLATDYTTHEYEFPLAKKQSSVVQCIDALSNRSTDFDLTGQVVWLVSRVTAHYIAASEIARGRDVLELGAGAGLCGLVASQLASSVALTDFEPEVLSLLQRNLKHVGSTCASSAVASLSWGSEEDLVALPRNRFSLICGADIVYWQHSIVPLFVTVKAALAEDGVFILGYTERVSAMTDLLLKAAAEVANLEHCVLPWTWLTDAADGVPPEYADHLHRMTLFRFTHRR